MGIAGNEVSGFIDCYLTITNLWDYHVPTVPLNNILFNSVNAVLAYVTSNDDII